MRTNRCGTFSEFADSPLAIEVVYSFDHVCSQEREREDVRDERRRSGSGEDAVGDVYEEGVEGC